MMTGYWDLWGDLSSWLPLLLPPLHHLPGSTPNVFRAYQSSSNGSKGEIKDGRYRKQAEHSKAPRTIWGFLGQGLGFGG